MLHQKNSVSFYIGIIRNMADYYKGQPENTMPIVYENYLSDKSEYIKRICEFVGVEFKDDYVMESKRIVAGVIF